MGQVHTERLHGDGRARVVAVWDVEGSAAARLRDSAAPGARVFGTLEELLAAGPYDAVVLATPTTAHYEQILACREYKIPAVLCEKPLAESRARIRELIEMSEQGVLRLSVGYQRRYWSTYRTLRAELRSGRWGRILAVTSTNAERWQQTIAGTWRDDPNINWGGFVGDAGSHKIDAVFYVSGLTALEVYAGSAQWSSRVEIATSVSAVLETGVPLTMSFAGNSECFVEDLHVHCERATLMLRDGRMWIARNNERARLPAAFPAGDPTIGFVDSLLAGRPFLSPPQCALPVFDFTRGLLESGRTGRPVSLGGDAAP